MNKFAWAVLLVFAGSGASLYAQREIIVPPGAKPGGNYSQGILTGDTLFVSGQGGEDAAGKIPADFEAEVKQCLDNIDAVLKTAGMSQANVVSVQVYLADRAKFQQMNAVYIQPISRIPGPPELP